jgi:hypothetical protein
MDAFAMVIVTVVLSIVLFAALSAFMGGWLAVTEIGFGARVIGVAVCVTGIVVLIRVTRNG